MATNSQRSTRSFHPSFFALRDDPRCYDRNTVSIYAECGIAIKDIKGKQEIEGKAKREDDTKLFFREGQALILFLLFVPFFISPLHIIERGRCIGMENMCATGFGETKIKMWQRWEKKKLLRP